MSGPVAKFGAALILDDKVALKALGMVMLRYCVAALVAGLALGVLIGWWWFG